MNTNYLSCAATAKLVRQALKESFPGVKFSVRSDTYAGGASIRVKWQDGPAGNQVKAVTDTFEGAYFDGMIDYKGSRYHKLDGEPVRFGANFIFEERKLSKAGAEKVQAALAARSGGYRGEVQGDESWGFRVDVEDCWRYALRELEEQLGMEPRPSPTLARVAFAGDDGYGQGTVGRDPAKPNGDQAYKAMAARMEREL